MELISSYYSDDGVLEARVYLNNWGQYVNQYLVNNIIIKTESYEDHNEVYHENAAENFVLGIKTI
jgi:hypothetical protein